MTAFCLPSYLTLTLLELPGVNSIRGKKKKSGTIWFLCRISKGARVGNILLILLPCCF